MLYRILLTTREFDIRKLVVICRHGLKWVHIIHHWSACVKPEMCAVMYLYVSMLLFSTNFLFSFGTSPIFPDFIIIPYFLKLIFIFSLISVVVFSGLFSECYICVLGAVVAVIIWYLDLLLHITTIEYRSGWGVRHYVI